MELDDELINLPWVVVVLVIVLVVVVVGGGWELGAPKWPNPLGTVVVEWVIVNGKGSVVIFGGFGAFGGFGGIIALGGPLFLAAQVETP